MDAGTKSSNLFNTVMLQDRINNYIQRRGINPLKTAKNLQNQMGYMIPVWEVKAIMDLILTGEIEQFLNEADDLLPDSQKSTTPFDK